MTARDEAIAYMVDQEPADPMENDWIDCGRLLDAIPADVLARYAIERGGLVLYERLDVANPAEKHIDRISLYQVVGS